MKVRYAFVMEYKDKKTGEWTLNTLPIFYNTLFRKNLNITAGNLPFTMIPQLPNNEYLAATLAPINSQINLATDELAFPADIDNLSLNFLLKDYTYAGFINPHQMKKYDYKNEHVILELFVPPEQAKEYRDKGTLPTTGYKSSTGVPADYELLTIRYTLDKLSPVTEYFYTEIKDLVSSAFIRYVEEPFTDTRLIYTVSVL
jgi:hypothetical protein